MKPNAAGATRLYGVLKMDTKTGGLKQMHEDQGRQKIKDLQDRIKTTQYNIEVSEALIDTTPSDKDREKRIKKNSKRRHAVASLNKEIRDTEQTMAQRAREVST